MQTFNVGDKIKWKFKNERWGDSPSHEIIYTIKPTGRVESPEGEWITLREPDCDYVKVDSEETLKTWGEMTDEEKGALLLAHHEGKSIEFYWKNHQEWFPDSNPSWYHRDAYRIKPEVETVVSYWCPKWGMRLKNPTYDTTHKITFQTVNDEPDLSSVKMEKL